MGYRSCLAGAIEFDNKEEAESYLKQELFDKEDASYFFVKNNFIFFSIDWIKWYEDYPHVKKIINFFENSCEINGFRGYELHRFGEEYEDYEYSSGGEYVGKISFLRSLHIDSDD